MSRLPGNRKLISRTLADLKRNWKLYGAIIAIVSLPADIIETYFAPGSGLQSYLSMAGLFMNVALIYAIIRKSRRKDKFGVRTAYYSGSHAVLRLFIVLLWLGVMLLPLALGSEIYAAGVASAISPSLGEQLLLGVVGLIVALPTLWLVTRFGISLIAVVDHEARPVMSLRLAWRLTRGRFWAVLGRFAMLLVWLILILALPAIILLVLYATLHWLVWFMLLQFVASLVGLPISLLYSFYLYEALGGAEAFGKEAA